MYIHQLLLWLKHANKQADINNPSHTHTHVCVFFSRIAYKLPETNPSSVGRSLHYTETTQRSPKQDAHVDAHGSLLLTNSCIALRISQTNMDQLKALLSSNIRDNKNG
jgi:hypothetical protein